MTATPRAGYRLTAWGGRLREHARLERECTFTMNANKTVSATFSPKPRSGPLTLIVVSDGSHNSLLLEWTGGPSDATKWQYRTRMWRNDEPQAWSPWTDIPNSDAHTRSYRLTSLSSGQPYDYELRAVRGTVAGAPSRLAEGTTQYPSPRIPIIDAGQIVEGDGRTQWRIHGLPWVITIPDGMRIRGGEATISSSGDSGVALRDVSSGSVIGISALTGKETERFIATSATDDAAQSAPARDVNALFDRIMASIREVPVQSRQGCSSSNCTLTMNANKTVSATFALASPPPAPVLNTIATGDAGVLILEWTPDPDSVSPTHGVTGWQYRQRARQGGTTDGPWVWGEWTNVPGSAADTRSYRLTGLPRRVFYFEVRAVAGTLAGQASDTVKGRPPIIDTHGIPEMAWGQISEGGRTWRLSAGPTVIDVPAGTRLILEGGGLQGGLVTVSFRDVESGSWQIVNIATGADLGREIIAARPASNGKGTDAATERRDVGAIFDKIMASARIIEP